MTALPDPVEDGIDAEDAPSAARRLDRWSGDPNFMLSLARGMLALSTVAGARGRPISARQLSVATGLPPAAAQRCLYTLNALGFVRSNRNGAVPGPALAQLAASLESGAPMLWRCGPVLDALHEALDVSTSLAIPDRDGMMIVASSSTDAILRLQLPIGALLPIHCTSAGKVHLAGLDQEALRARLDRMPMPPLTPFTLTDPAALRDEVARTRARGFALSDQEQVLGVRTVAVPVRDAAGAVLGSLNAATLRAAVPLRVLRARVVPALREAAVRLEALGLSGASAAG